MEIFHIFLVIVGLAIIAISYMISEKITNRKEELPQLGTNPVQMNSVRGSAMQDSVEDIEEKIETIVRELTDSTVEKTDNKLSQISNEKIIAVSEFSDQILEKINQNHSEVIFLYNMLNEKETELKETVKKIDKTKIEIENSHNNFVETEEIIEEKINSPIRAMSVDNDKKKSRKEGKVQAGNNQNRVSRQADQLVEDNTVRSEEDMRNNKNIFYESDHNNNKQILEHYAKGKTVVEIARILELGQGEVKLVIDLFEKNRQAE